MATLVAGERILKYMVIFSAQLIFGLSSYAAIAPNLDRIMQFDTVLHSHEVSNLRGRVIAIKRLENGSFEVDTDVCHARITLEPHFSTPATPGGVSYSVASADVKCSPGNK